MDEKVEIGDGIKAIQTVVCLFLSAMSKNTPTDLKHFAKKKGRWVYSCSTLMACLLLLV